MACAAAHSESRLVPGSKPGSPTVRSMTVYRNRLFLLIFARIGDSLQHDRSRSREIPNRRSATLDPLGTERLPTRVTVPSRGDVGVVSAPIRYSVRARLVARAELDDNVDASRIRRFRDMVKLFTHDHPLDDHRARLDLAARSNASSPVDGTLTNPLLAAWVYCDNHRRGYAEVVVNPLAVCLPAKIGLWDGSWRKSYYSI